MVLFRKDETVRILADEWHQIDNQGNQVASGFYQVEGAIPPLISLLGFSSELIFFQIE